MELAAKAELRSPVLALRDRRGQTQRLLLTTPNVHPSEVMKVLLHVHGATHAAICLEGWAVEIEPPADADQELWKREALRGRLPPGLPRASQHPDRYDQLTLLGQIRDLPAGYRVHRSWRITNGTPRTFEEQTRAPYIDAPSNFWPMFVGERDVARIAFEHGVLRPLLARERRR